MTLFSMMWNLQYRLDKTKDVKNIKITAEPV